MPAAPQAAGTFFIQSSIAFLRIRTVPGAIMVAFDETDDRRFGLIGSEAIMVI